MAQYYLIVNPGSSSKKYALYQGGKELFFAHFEKDQDHYFVTFKSPGSAVTNKIEPAIFASAVDHFLQKILAEKVISNPASITAIGIRVVAAGSSFAQHKLIDQDYRQQLSTARQSAPLHLNPLLEELEQLSAIFPKLPIVGISDSAFHTTIPAASRHYAIPFSDTTLLDLHRFGYHGISVQSLLPKITSLLGHVPPRIIVCHLGGGASLTALQDGSSIDNSMGYTPLEGLIMATRVGNIDAGALIKLSQAKKLSLSELEEYLNTQSGLLGLSELSDDIRKLLELENSQPSAQLALSAYVTAIKKYIGAYTALLNGLDLLVFTATTGERSSIIRQRICDNLDGLGIHLDPSLNDQTNSTNAVISPTNSPVTVAVLTTNEMQAIAQLMQPLLD